MKSLKEEKGMARVRLTIIILVIMVLVAMALVLVIGEDGISLKINGNRNVSNVTTNQTTNEINNN